MSGTSKIEWTEQSWNPIVGCSLASPGCTNCYAMKMAGRIEATGHAAYQGLTQRAKSGFVWTAKLGFNEKALLEPLQRKKPTMYFVNSMGDLFHEDCPDEWIDRVFAVMALAPQHTFQVLTKRSARMREYLTARNGMGNSDLCRAINSIPTKLGNRHGALSMPLPNVWLGVSVEDQARADERIPDLLATPAAVRWLSCEPLLGPVDLNGIGTARTINGEAIYLDALSGEFWAPTNSVWDTDDLPDIDWIVAGGESGPDARPMHPDWARSLRDQCEAAGAPFFFKQWGEWAPHRPQAGGDLGGYVRSGRVRTVNPSGRSIFEQSERTGRGGEPGCCYMAKLGKKRAGRLLDGSTHEAFPVSAAMMERAL